MQYDNLYIGDNVSPLKKKNTNTNTNVNIIPLTPKGLEQSPIKPPVIPQMETIYIPTEREKRFMTALWNWLNGNKTIFALAIMTLANSLPPDTTVWVIPVVPILTWLAGILGGVGVLHKLAKATTAVGPNP